MTLHQWMQQSIIDEIIDTVVTFRKQDPSNKWILHEVDISQSTIAPPSWLSHHHNYVEPPYTIENDVIELRNLVVNKKYALWEVDSSFRTTVRCIHYEQIRFSREYGLKVCGKTCHFRDGFTETYIVVGEHKFIKAVAATNVVENASTSQLLPEDVWSHVLEFLSFFDAIPMRTLNRSLLNASDRSCVEWASEALARKLCRRHTVVSLAQRWDPTQSFLSNALSLLVPTHRARVVVSTSPSTNTYTLWRSDLHHHSCPDGLIKIVAPAFNTLPITCTWVLVLRDASTDEYLPLVVRSRKGVRPRLHPLIATEDDSDPLIFFRKVLGETSPTSPCHASLEQIGKLFRNVMITEEWSMLYPTTTVSEINIFYVCDENTVERAVGSERCGDVTWLQIIEEQKQGFSPLQIKKEPKPKYSCM